MPNSGCMPVCEAMEKSSASNKLESPGTRRPTVSNADSDQDLVETIGRKRHRRSSSRVRLKVYICLLILIVLALFSASSFLLYKYIENMLRQKDVCTTADCIRAAATIMATMDLTANPCEDFYQFACGNFYKEHPIPDTDFTEDWFTNRNHHVIRRIRDYLEENDTMEEPRPVRQARVMYRACNDVESLERLSLDPLLGFLDHLELPRNPPLDGDNVGISWPKAIAHIKRHIDKDIFIGFDVMSDPYNNTINRLAVGLPGDRNPLPSHSEHARLRKPSPRMMLAKGGSKANRAWRKYIVNTLNYVLKYNNKNISALNASVYEAAERIMKFEKALISLKENYTYTDPTREDLPDNMWVSQLQNITDSETSSYAPSQINWRTYLKELFDGTKGVSLDLDRKDRIAVYNLDYLTALVRLFADTPESTIILTVWWEVVYELAPHTTHRMRDLRTDFEERTIGESALPSRPTHCAYVVYKLLDVAVGTADTREYFLYHTKPRVNNMIDDIQDSFIEAVDKTKWIDRKTKAAIKDKVFHIKRRIGFPEWILDNEEVEGYYDTLEVFEKKHLENILTYLGHSVRSNFENLRSYNVYNSTGFNPLEVNAAYSVQDNMIFVPLGMIQYPFYHLGIDALNYGAIGSILGHELVHALDTDGRRYDKYGNYRNWWTNQSIEAFTDRVSCLVEKYSDYYIEEIDSWVDGNLTLGENIADHGGLRAALWGYHRRVARKGQEPYLPGLQQYTHDQLLYLGFANMWCENWSNQNMLWTLEGEHAPNFVRVLGTLKDSPEFGRTWNCPRGSEMNPVNKCHVW